MRFSAPRRKPEPTIALINIVFLMLIFFMVAGTLAPPLDPKLTLVETDRLDRRDPPAALVLDAEGVLSFQGAVTEDLSLYMATLGDAAVAQVIPDRAVPAVALLDVARRLEEAGAKKVMIVTEQALR